MGKQKFSKALKRAIAIEYMQSGLKRADICIKYGIERESTLSSWIHSCLSPLEIREKCVSLPPVNQTSDGNMAEDVTLTSSEQLSRIELLEKQILKLEKELKKSRDKNLALNTLIDIAEEQGIRIRKKSGAKR